MLVKQMAETQKNGKNEHFSMKRNGSSSDLLTKSMNGNDFRREIYAVENGKEEIEIELSLGLSLNGKFGLDPKRANQMIVRSSSTASLTKENHARVVPGEGHAQPLRTCYLPAEEWRKRKEMQSVRRMEAKRKRMEKKNVRAVREKVDVVENGNNGHIQGQSGNLNGLASSQGSQGSGSSGISDFENQPTQGISKSTEMKSPSGDESPPEQNELMKTTPGTAKQEEVSINRMVDMPSVSIIGDGPNGRKVEGFLYRYHKGEEVKIVCVCHGRFLTPTEFVKHAGGSDLTHPLRRIIVEPSSLI